jgi:hypothetical protein
MLALYRTLLFPAALASLAALGGLSGCASTGSSDGLPPVTEDGLVRIDSKKVDAVYWAEGATLAGYDAVMLTDTPVAFRKNWMRDFNASRQSLSDRVDEEDMSRIKSELSSAFRESFTEALSKAGYRIVEEPGEDVLLLRPAIVDLDVNAPDLQSANMTRSYTADAGEMTLYLELYDSATGDKIGQVVDQERAMDSGRIEYTSRVTNRAEANRILGKWSKLLVEALDEAHGKT